MIHKGETMRIINCEQRSPEWHALRTRPTASEFGRFITPARCEYSSQATGYACSIIAKRLGVYQDPPETWWMQWGTEHELNAKHWYRHRCNYDVTDVGFVMPDHTDDYGGSPDALVGLTGLLEIKCPAPQTLIAWHAAGEMPREYLPQVQGLLLITGRAYCDFVGFHPDLTPFLVSVEADPIYQAKIVECLTRLLDEIDRISGLVGVVRHELVNPGTMRDELRWDDDN